MRGPGAAPGVNRSNNNVAIGHRATVVSGWAESLRIPAVDSRWRARLSRSRGRRCRDNCVECLFIADKNGSGLSVKA